MHKFCPTCGSSLFVDPHMDDPELIVVNVCFFFDRAPMLWTALIGPKRCGCLGISMSTSCSSGNMTDSIDYNLDMKCNRSSKRRGYISRMPSAIC